MENLEDPDLEDPPDISPTEQQNPLKMFHWKEEVKMFMLKEEGLKTGKQHLYTLIWGQCTKNMQIELAALSIYEDMQEKQDPIMLINAIKGLTYSFRDHKYIFGDVWRAYCALFYTVQKEGEDLKDHHERFQNQI